MLTLRHCLVIIGLMFWQGGFTFYAAVVVPIGTEILGSTLHQGFITREVTRFINISAAVALVLLAWDMLAGGDPSRLRRWASLGVWLFMVMCQALLFLLHPYLDELMVRKGRIIHDPETFRAIHRIYLWTHTIQWGAGLVFLALMLRAWQEESTGRAPLAASRSE